MGVVFGGDPAVVDPYHLQLAAMILLDGPQKLAPGATESVNADLC